MNSLFRWSMTLARLWEDSLAISTQKRIRSRFNTVNLRGSSSKGKCLSTAFTLKDNWTKGQKKSNMLKMSLTWRQRSIKRTPRLGSNTSLWILRTAANSVTLCLIPRWLRKSWRTNFITIHTLLDTRTQLNASFLGPKRRYFMIKNT